MSIPATESIPVAPPPWTLKGTLYIFMMYTATKDVATLSANPDFLYSPLEANSSFSNGQLKGGLSRVQLIRYSETPVGPYDESVLIPGYFKYTVETKDKNGQAKRAKRRNLRCTKVFVSQEKTCWNGRKNWNIPKHLAKFEFVDLPNGGTRIAVFPLQPDNSGEERIPSQVPFVTTVFKPSSYVPSFACSTDWAKYIGWDLSLVQPPLPTGTGPELVGTQQWCKIPAVESSKKTSLGWFDLRQKGNDTSRTAEQTPLLRDAGTNEDSATPENFWPDLGRWRIGMKMEDAIIEFPVGEHWDGPARGEAS